MSWFRVDDKFHSHPKVKGLKAADPLALWLLCGSYCSDHPKLEGAVPLHVAADFAGGDKKAKSLAATLVSRGLWASCEDGWRFHDWHEYQPSAEETGERRTALSAKRASAGRLGAAKRWQASADANGKAMANEDGKAKAPVASDSPSPVPSRPGPDPNPMEMGGEVATEPANERTEPRRLDPRAKDAGLFGTEGASWTDGVKRAKGGGAQTPPHWGENKFIAEVLRVHAPNLTGSAAAEWIVASAEAFARDVASGRQRGNITVRNWKGWQDTTSWKPPRAVAPLAPIASTRAPDDQPATAAEIAEVLAKVGGLGGLGAGIGRGAAKVITFEPKSGVHATAPIADEGKSDAG